jgi:hypothetical protein
MGQQLLEALRLEANLQIFKNSYDAAQGILATLNSNDSKLRYNSALRVRLLEMCEERLTAAKEAALFILGETGHGRVCSGNACTGTKLALDQTDAPVQRTTGDTATCPDSA